MRTKSRTISVASTLVAAMAATVAIGCSSSPNYGNPGYYGYGQPVYTAPGGSYVQPGTVTPVAPSGGQFVPPNDPSATNIGFGDAPTFDPATDVTPQPDDNLVPEYRDPGNLDSAGGGFDDEPTPRFEDDAGFDDFGNGGFDDKGFDDKGFDDGGFDDGGFDDGAFDETSSRLPLPYDDPAAAQLHGMETAREANNTSYEAADFEQPISLQPTSAPVRERVRLAPAGRAQLEETSIRTPAPNPYDHDPGFQWIRGVADHDEATDSWSVMYSLRPDADDEFGGSLTIVGDDESLAALESGMVVAARGTIARSTKDAFGKPVYRIESISQLVPRN